MGKKQILNAKISKKDESLKRNKAIESYFGDTAIGRIKTSQPLGKSLLENFFEVLV